MTDIEKAIKKYGLKVTGWFCELFLYTAGLSVFGILFYASIQPTENYAILWKIPLRALGIMSTVAFVFLVTNFSFVLWKGYKNRYFPIEELDRLLEQPSGAIFTLEGIRIALGLERRKLSWDLENIFVFWRFHR